MVGTSGASRPAYDGGGRLGTRAGAIHAREPARVLHGTAEHTFFVKRVCRIAETRRNIPSLLCSVKMRMEHDLRSASCHPPNRLGITPSLVAYHHPESQITRCKDMPSGALCVRAFLRRVNRDFVLEAPHASVSIDYEHRRKQGAIDDALRADTTGNIGVGRTLRNVSPRTVQEFSVRRRDRLASRPITGDGKQMMSAFSSPACAIACVANVTDSLGVDGKHPGYRAITVLSSRRTGISLFSQRCTVAELMRR